MGSDRLPYRNRFLFFAAIAYLLVHVGVASSGGEATVNQGVILVAAIAFGPTVASVFGTAGGALFGFYLARRKVRVSADD